MPRSTCSRRAISLSVNDIKGIENFSDVAKSAWSTDDGKTTFCMPMASVIHGFIYNKKIFDELKLTPPKTVAEFHAVLDKIKADGRYTPLAMGTADQWEAATMGFQNIGAELLERRGRPQGAHRRQAEVHRSGLREDLHGTGQLGALPGQGLPVAEISRYPEPVRPRAGRRSFRPDPGTSRPSASRPISSSTPSRRRCRSGASKCYISDHTDIALGINAKSQEHRRPPRPSWPGWPRRNSPQIYANALPGFFPLTKDKVEVKDPVAAKFVGWRGDLRELDPQLLPDPVPRHAEPRERALERERPGAQRLPEA